MEVPKYIERVRAAKLEQRFPAQVLDIAVRHDSWCRQLNNKGWCNCNPDITVTVMDNKEHEGKEYAVLDGGLLLRKTWAK